MTFQGGPDLLSPLWIRPWHASERRYWSEMFLSAYGDIIGRKVGLDYNSWYACLPLIRHVGRSSRFKLFANFDSRSLKERERERETAWCLHTNLLFWLGFLEYRNAMFRSVNQFCYSCFRRGPKPQLIVRVGFCTAKSNIPQYYM